MAGRLPFLCESTKGSWEERPDSSVTNGNERTGRKVSFWETLHDTTLAPSVLSPGSSQHRVYELNIDFFSLFCPDVSRELCGQLSQLRAHGDCRIVPQLLKAGPGSALPVRRTEVFWARD